jgi:hypothetical protein
VGAIIVKVPFFLALAVLRAGDIWQILHATLSALQRLVGQQVRRNL